MPTQIRGIYGIMVTPFDETGELDEESLRSEVRFCARAGSHGLVWPVSSSEFQMLSHDERKRGAEAIMSELKRLPEAKRPRLVVGTAGVNARDAADLSAHAEKIGADAVIAMPPFATANMPKGEIPAYYRRIAQATTLPIVVQNQGGPTGNVMSVELIVQMAKEIPGIQYVKEESGICTHMISGLLAKGAGVLTGVFGGSGGYYLVQEMERGSCGMMSSCHLVDLQVVVWDLFHKGDVEGARKVLMQTLPVQILWLQLGLRIPKEVLKLRGVIKHAGTRRGDNVDEVDLKELKFWLEYLKPQLTV
ncbi:MAG: dihydrodipicolinate synthase family protein [Chloroflexota bacterium]|nr:dihydrodipicolinate synthase family protein [Chloroflexota bacterium]